MDRRFVVVSGLPGSGKSVLGRQVASALGLPVLDKDDILEGLFHTKGVGNSDWRRALSRDSDEILRTEAIRSGGAVLVSHWRLPGMPANSGTPIDWLGGLSTRIVHVHCVCPMGLASQRFAARKRHPGHLDHEKSQAEIRLGIEQVAACGTLDLEPRVDVDTSREVQWDRVLGLVRSAFEMIDQ